MKDKRDAELLIQARSREDELRTKRLQEEMHQKIQYRHELQDQMILKEKTKRFLYEEFLREKKLLDDVIQRMYEEDCREMEERMCKMKKTREEIAAFKTAQGIWREKKRKELEEENIKIQEYLRQKFFEEQEKRYKKASDEARKEKILENLSKIIYEEEVSFSLIYLVSKLSIFIIDLTLLIRKEFPCIINKIFLIYYYYLLRKKIIIIFTLKIHKSQFTKSYFPNFRRKGSHESHNAHPRR